MKDKDQLMQYRRLIETKMEAFKVTEKEAKTKTFSKEGLARAEKLDPEEIKKNETIEWVGEVIDQIQTLIDEQDLEVEKLSAGKGKKTNKNQIEECNQHLSSHKFHMSKLEGIMRLIRNDRISAETVDEVKEDLEYYIESHEDADYMMAYDEECFYEALGLDDLDVVNVDRVTQTSAKVDDDMKSASSGSKKEKHTKKTTTSSSMIPLTIGRARKSKKGADKDEVSSSTEATPTKAGRSNSTSGPAPVVAPTPKAPAVVSGGASMAAVLKRESEERQKAQQAAAQQQQAEQARQAAELLRQQQAEQARQAAELQQQQAQAAQQKADAMKLAAAQAQQAQQRQAAQAQQDAAAKQAAQAQAQPPSSLNAGLSGLSLDNAVVPNAQVPAPSLNQAPGHNAPNKDATERYLNALNDSFLQIPGTNETERNKQYTPRNPYPNAPASYPVMPSPIFENPAVFEKLGTDALFFIFYYAQGTYQQYLAARELKKQSWRYHKKYMTWFQRHEEPKVTTDDYEQGTYVYFDYETGWCQRIKSDFRFEYSFLEDSLA